MAKVDCKAIGQIQDQEKIQLWLKNAINQNIGQFSVHGKNLTYDANVIYLFSYKSKLRQYIVWVTEWRWFDNLVIFLILLGSLCQAIQSSYTNEDYDEKTQKMIKVLEDITSFTTYFFILEASMKIISQGLIRHKNAYLRDGWNIVDFLVVMSSIFEFL